MKIMLDECITVGPAEAIKQFAALESDSPHVEFLLDYLKGRDNVIGKDWSWVDSIVADGGWFVISADLDKNKTAKKRLVDGPALHKILPPKGISAVYLSGTIQRETGDEKARAIISMWKDIRSYFENANPGSMKKLRKQPNGNQFSLMDF